MGRPILTLVQRALDELGLTNPRVTSLVAASDNQGLQMLALAGRVGDKLMRKGDWPQLQTEWLVRPPDPVTGTVDLLEGSCGLSSLALPYGARVTPGEWSVDAAGVPSTAVAVGIYGDGTGLISDPAYATAQNVPIVFRQFSFDLPDDCQAVQAESGWDRGNRWQLIGGLTPQQDQGLRSGLFPQGPRWRYRITGRKLSLVVRPAPQPPATIAIEYLSRWWITDSATGLPAPDFKSDQDTVVWDDDIFILGLKYLYFRERG